MIETDIWRPEVSTWTWVTIYDHLTIDHILSAKSTASPGLPTTRMLLLTGADWSSTPECPQLTVNISVASPVLQSPLQLSSSEASGSSFTLLDSAILTRVKGRRAQSSVARTVLP